MRLFDIVMSLIGLVMFSPVFALASVFIVMEDGGPVFFRQPRLGRRRRPFSVIKFRTMYDGVVTSAGHILRTTGLDEIPQFLNVLRGEMSMVGPRPLIQEDVDRLGWGAVEYDDRWSVSPGLTGVAQIFGGHSARVSIFLDRKYLARRSVCLNLWAVMVSFGINILGKKRVRRWLRGR